jgi:hypothetical protein
MTKNELKMQEMNIPKWNPKLPIMVYEKDSPHGLTPYIEACGIDPNDTDIHADWVIMIAHIGVRNKTKVYISSLKATFDEVIDYCMKHGIRIISSSFYCGETEERIAALKRFYDWGGIWISAVGNTNGRDVKFPANSPYTLGCSATNSPDCDGPEIDITVPSWWEVTGIRGQKATLNGTSGANPAAAFCVDYILTAYPSWSLGDVKKFIGDNSVPGREKFEKVFRFPDGFRPNEEGKMVFKDTVDHWAKDAIDKMSEEGLLEGFSDGTFKPDLALTRAEAAVIFERLMESNQ